MRDLKQAIEGAPNFTYGELVRSNTAKRRKLDNTPNEEQWQALELLAVNVLQPLRDHFGPITVTSGYRSKELCVAIGSSITSNHTRGEAADLEFAEGVDMIDVCKWIHKHLQFRELILEYYPDGWVHVAHRKGDDAHILKVKDDTMNYTRVQIMELHRLYEFKHLLSQSEEMDEDDYKLKDIADKENN